MDQQLKRYMLVSFKKEGGTRPNVVAVTKVFPAREAVELLVVYGDVGIPEIGTITTRKGQGDYLRILSRPRQSVLSYLFKLLTIDSAYALRLAIENNMLTQFIVYVVKHGHKQDILRLSTVPFEIGKEPYLTNEHLQQIYHVLGLVE